MLGRTYRRSSNILSSRSLYDSVDDWLTISPDGFEAHEMHCKVLVAQANKRGDYLVKFWCDENLIQNYWFSLFNDRLYVSLTDSEP